MTRTDPTITIIRIIERVITEYADERDPSKGADAINRALRTCCVIRLRPETREQTMRTEARWAALRRTARGEARCGAHS